MARPQLSWVLSIAAVALVARALSPVAAVDAQNATAGRCQATPGPVPASLGLSPFYTQHVDANGLPIVGSAQVEGRAFGVARNIVLELTANPAIRAALQSAHVRVGIMAETEVTTDMPGHADLNRVFPQTNWNTRARGLGATLARPLSSVGEENLLGRPTDRYRGENILVHEFAHTVWELGVQRLPDGEARQRELLLAFGAAIRQGRWENTYAAPNAREHFAAGVQSYFDANLSASPADGIHNDIDTRDELRTYDPALYAIIERVFPPSAWRPTCP